MSNFVEPLNGFSVSVSVVPVLVIVNAFVLLSMNVVFWQVSSWVLVIAVSGAVGGEKLAV